MQKRYLTILIIFLFCKVYSEETFFLKNSNKYEIDNKVALESHNYNFCFIDSNLFYMYEYPDSTCSIKILSVDMSKIIEISIPSELFKFRCYRTNICISTCNDDLIIGFGEKILLYKRVGDLYSIVKIFNLENMFSLDLLYYFNRIKLIDNKIIGINDEYKPQKSIKQQAYYFIIDINDSSLYKIQNYDYPQGYYWTLFQPKKIIDVSENFDLITDITNYNITVNNHKSKEQYILSREFTDWKAHKYDINKFHNKHPMAIINKLYADTLTESLVHRAEFINDRTILVTYTLYKNEDTDYVYDEYHDIWELHDNNWKLKFADIDSKNLRKNADGSDDSPLNIYYLIVNDRIISFHNEKEKLENNFILLREYNK